MGVHPVTKVVAFSCVHAPFTRKDAFAWLISVIRREKPTHIVNLGDWMEGDAASVHANENIHTIEDEYEAATSQSVQIHKAAPKAKLVWLLGNHDDNIQSCDPRRIPKKFRGAVHWSRSMYRDEFARWEQVPYEKSKRGTYQHGPIVFYHGYDAGANTDQREAMQFCRLTGWQAGRLFVRGHTHSPEPVTQCRYGSVRFPWWYCNVGTLGPMKPMYARRRCTANWGAGCLVATIAGWKWTAEVREFHA